SINGTKMIEAKKHAYWFDSSEINNVFIEEQRREGSTSAQNLIEAVLIVELLKKIDKKYTNSSKLQKTSIGVISFYYDQVLLIKNMLRDEKFSSIDVEVNTVDRFQGKEKEIIFVSLVRNVKNHHHGTNSHIAAFERINVAFSRAQNLLVIVGAKDMYVDQPVVLTDMNNGEEKTTMAYKDIIEELMMKGAYFSANEVISSSFGDEIINEINKAGVK
uniref:AAA domain-containing protein n=1 Tax=Faecalibacillus intestinalis TaxID=1982626 RepID=UPI003AB35B8C